jgi:hypothetical protein
MKEVQAPAAHLWYKEEKNLLGIQLKQKARLGLEEVKNIFLISREIINFTMPLLLLDARADFKITAEAFSYFFQKVNSHSAVAVLKEDARAGFFVTLYLRLKGTTSEVKFFSSEEAALDWLMKNVRNERE